jgi:hypothetical protein
MKLDPDTLNELRRLSPRQAFDRLKEAVYQTPDGVGSWEFVEGIQTLVDEGILTWDEVEEFEGGPLR